ncbi:MAG: hypothetical protein O6952_09340 [Planctomycetota bacterium]|nr:hypothetical protein [Planctomycetota bacterium]
MKRTARSRAEARGLEETFTDRFELGLQRVGEVLNPLDGKVYPIGQSSSPRYYHKEADVADRMKSLGVFERDILGEMPRNRLGILRIRKSGFFSSRVTRLVIVAATCSPLEEFILEGSSSRRLDLAEMNRVVDEVVKQEDIFYFIGVLSTTGWSDDCKGRLPQGPNYLLAAVENIGGSRWQVDKTPDKRWGRVFSAFDAETRPEKLARCQAYFAENTDLALKGGHVVLEVASELLGVPDDIFRRAVDEAARRDPDLAVMEVSGKKILKRARI